MADDFESHATLAVGIPLSNLKLSEPYQRQQGDKTVAFSRNLVSLI